jgi:hypothetical protein
MFHQAIGYDKAGAALIFDSIDQDGSNEISREEFLDFFGQPQNGELFRKLRYAGIKTKVPKNVSVMKTGCAGPARASSTNMAMLEVIRAILCCTRRRVKSTTVLCANSS